MKARFKFICCYFISWLFLFIIGKLLFLFYHFNQSFQLPIGDWFRIISHGFMLDLSTTGYITVFPLLILILTSFTRYKIPYWIISSYTLIMLVLFLVITIVDLEIYTYWGVRLDNTAFRFLNTPREVLASTKWSLIIIFLLALGAFTTLLFYFYRQHIGSILVHSEKPGWKGMLVFILLYPFVFLAIRGGVGIATMSVSRVYFHPDPYPNHAAINVFWNLGDTMLEKKDQPNPFKYLDDKTSRKYMDELLASDSTRVELLKTRRPNIILIVLESYTAKLIEPLGGLPGVTPNFNKLSSESIFFTNLYANDSRTDKSLVAILSAYPALGKISIIKFPNKTQKLGMISRDLNKIGYHTAFYYGGDVDFGNIRSYMVNGNFQKIIEASDFPKPLNSSRWGVPDQYTFQRLFDDCNASEKPFFKTFLTLSNHEPFDIPTPPKFGTKNTDLKVSSSAFYTDSCIGDFIQKARMTAWWDSTLIIMLADHGTVFPGNSIVYYPEKYKIPMIWAGGAIRKDTTISTYMSQSDLAKTLFNQMNIDASDYPFSKDIFSAKHHFCFYEYKNGFGMISDSGNYVFDNDLKKIILSGGTVSPEFIQAGKAIQQEVYEVFLRN
jgi:phosphoglycerol transferase MdoB-like AlkP superfamily enzyme